MPLGLIRLLAILLAAAMAGGCSLPLVSEAELASQSAAEFEKLRNTTPISTDGSVRRYVNCISKAIIAELDEPYASKDWQIEIFESEQINAFAMPGGKIGVFTGIQRAAETTDQLAAVIGHEIAHVTEQHSVKRVNRELTTRGSVAAVAAVLGGPAGTTDLLAMGAQIGLSLPYGRSQESEADIDGLIFMADAGFDPRASIQLWKNMERESEAAPPEFLSTHPSSSTRIGDLIAALPPALERYNLARAAGKNPQCSR